MLTPISFSSRFDDFFIEPLFRHPDGRPPELCLLPKPFNPADAGKIINKKRTYFLPLILVAPTKPLKRTSDIRDVHVLFVRRVIVFLYGVFIRCFR